MRLPRKWVLSLGLLATAPGVTWAEPYEAPANTASSVSNQEMAERLASALKQARLRGKGVQIEYKSGVASISGQVGDADSRALATQVLSEVPGVQSVENRLTVSGTAGARPAPRGVMQANHVGAGRQPVRQVAGTTPARSNQAVAQNIADALTSAGLSDYDIEVRFKNGVASLSGSVDNPQAAAMAQQAAQSVDGVGQVLNRLSVNGRPAAQTPQGVQQTSYPQFPQAPMMAPGGPQAMPISAQQMMPANGPAPMMAPGGVGGVVHPAGHHIYNSPNVPNYAWPSYAAYDNSAAITYPSMYDASAFPYIGPFYPYPQVPLGWRRATLEWDDGYWNLKFNSRTDKWWWFLNPHNWE